MAIDPICGMEVDEKTPAGSSVFEGQNYYFCFKGCNNKFDANPPAYVGTATVLAGKGTSNVKLEPLGENALTGNGSLLPTADMKVVVFVTLPGQPPVQARFTPLEKPKPSAK